MGNDPNDPVDWTLLREEWERSARPHKIAERLAEEICATYDLAEEASLRDTLRLWLLESLNSKEMAELGARLEQNLTFDEFCERD